MPAFNLMQLNAQLDETTWKFTRPLEFQKALQDLLESYADWAYKPGHAVHPSSLVLAYNVQPLILQKIEQMLTPLVRENPAAGLSLADILWRHSYLEPRLIAVAILGKIPVDPPDEVLKRFNSWCQPDEPIKILDALFNQGSERLRREKPEIWLEWIERRASHADISIQQMGLRAMLAIVNDRSFENLPPIFRLTGVLMLKTAEQLQMPIINVLEALVQRSPQETYYFLRQIAISEENNMNVRNHVQRSIRFFDMPLKHRLRQILLEKESFEESDKK